MLGFPSLVAIGLAFLVVLAGAATRRPNHAEYTNKHQKMTVEMVGFTITPRNEIQVQSLRGIRSSDIIMKSASDSSEENALTEIPMYFQGGRIHVNSSIQIMVPKQHLRAFNERMLGAGLTPFKKYYRIKVKYYIRPLMRENDCGNMDQECNNQLCCPPYVCTWNPTGSICGVQSPPTQQRKSNDCGHAGDECESSADCCNQFTCTWNPTGSTCTRLPPPPPTWPGSRILPAHSS